MTNAALPERLKEFIEFARSLKGDEKGEAQIFLDRFFQAFGHKGCKEAGAELEGRVRGSKRKGTGFIDLRWNSRLLVEMKKRGEKLERHFDQLYDYWHDNYPKSKYSILCNFDEFWIYDFFSQRDPVDKILLEELPRRFMAFAFMFAEKPRKPQFDNDRVAVSREAADEVARAFNEMIRRGVERERAQRFILQCVFAMFAEDFDLLPRGLFSELIQECKSDTVRSYDLLGGLFRQMNDPAPARGGRFQGVQHFNGGLFEKIAPVELERIERHHLEEAAKTDWSKIEPPVFGAIFEGSMGKEERHAFGAHFTNEADIMKIVRPTILRPWMARIDDANTLDALRGAYSDLLKYRVLDPACGCGNFLYIAYRELKRVEIRLLRKLHEKYPAAARKEFGFRTLVSLQQFFGIDINPFATELTKVTLMLAKELAIAENRLELAEFAQGEEGLDLEAALPLDNLDANIRCDDSLFCDWPKVDAIIGNPPFLGSRYLPKERGYDYQRKVHAAFPSVPKMADYCAYWFRRAHDALPEGGRAGLVGTNTIRQNESREASLDYIIANQGAITDAVSTQVWSGEAQVHVSIVNWLKGKESDLGLRFLYTQKGDDPKSEFLIEQIKSINSSLSIGIEVILAKKLQINQKTKICFIGQYPFNDGFLLSFKEAVNFLSLNKKNKEIIFPYMIGRDLVELSHPSRWIIDFGQRSLHEVMKYSEPFQRLKELVMPDVLAKAEEEKEATGKGSTRWTRMAEKWWQFRDYQPGTMSAITLVSRYIAISRVTKRPIFEFISNKIHPDNTLVIFSVADNYSFGVLQSGLHSAWFKARCSTLTERYRYTSNTVFDTFPWPQNPSLKQVQAVAKAAVDLRAFRRRIMQENGWSLRDLYRTLETPGKNALRDAHEALDKAVRAAYGMKKDQDPLKFLLDLNLAVAAREEAGEPVVGPGLPPCVTDPAPFITDDCIRPDPLPGLNQ
jgi:hypothetical protein